MAGKIFITGGTGFIGKFLIGRIIGTWPMRVLTRHNVVAAKSSIPYVTYVHGDIMSPESLIRGMRGCSYVIHMAAKVSFNQKDDKTVRESIITGTRNVVSIAEKMGVHTLIYVSSAIVKGASKSPEDLRDETFSSNYECAYVKAKKDAERIVNNSKINNVCVLYPTNCRSDLYAKEFCENSLIKYTSGGNNIIDPEDVCSGILRSLHCTGRTNYIIGGHNVSYFEIFKTLQEISEKKKIMVPVHPALRHFIKSFAMNGSWYLTPFIVDTAFAYKYYDTSKARKNINLIPEYQMITTLRRGLELYERRSGNKQTAL